MSHHPTKAEAAEAARRLARAAAIRRPTETAALRRTTDGPTTVPPQVLADRIQAARATGDLQAVRLLAHLAARGTTRKENPS